MSLDALSARYARLESRTSPSGDEAWLNWAVRVRSTGCCVGTVQATVTGIGNAAVTADTDTESNAQDMLRRAHIAYELGVEHQGQGIATEACRRVIQFLFAEWAVQEILADVDTRNESSMRLLLRLGFQPGDVRANADFFKGVSSDERRFMLRRMG